MAQLKLAEQIIAEKDHEIHSLGYRADVAMMEKEALEEEVMTIKSVQNTSSSSAMDTSHDTSTPIRVRRGGREGSGGREWRGGGRGGGREEGERGERRRERGGRGGGGRRGGVEEGREGGV